MIRRNYKANSSLNTEAKISKIVQNEINKILSHSLKDKKYSFNQSALKISNRANNSMLNSFMKNGISNAFNNSAQDNNFGTNITQMFGKVAMELQKNLFRNF